MKILITGHSGSGKSTEAEKLSVKTGYKVHSLDDTTGWREFHKLVIGDRQEWLRLYKEKSQELLEEALALEGDWIIEGAQIFMVDWIAPWHKLVVLDPPKEEVIRRRTARQVLRDLESGKHADCTYLELKAKKRANSEKLYNEFSEEFEAFKARTMNHV